MALEEENTMVEENSVDSYYQICELIDEISYRNPSIDKEKFSKLKSYYQGDTRSIAEIKAEIDQYLIEMDDKEDEKEFGPPEEEITPEDILEDSDEKEEEETEKTEDNSKVEDSSTEEKEEEYEETEEKEETTSQSTEKTSESETNEDTKEPEIYEGLDVYQTPEQENNSQQSEIYEGLLDAYQIPGIKTETYETERTSELGDMFNSYESFSHSEPIKDNTNMDYQKPKQFVKSFDSGNTNEGGYTDVVAMGMLTTAALFSIITIILAIAVIM